MHSTFALAAFAAVALAAPAPQAPSTSAPAGCSPSYSGRFQIAAVNITTTGKRSIEARQSSCDGPGALTLTLNNGQLIDSAGRIGSIVANRQFQFDGPPPQAGAIYTSGWSSCSNGSLAIGGNTRFYQCLSGTFYNLYDQAVGAQCNPVTLQIQGCSAGGAAGGGGQVGAKPDGQPTGTGQGAPPATQIGDGQIQAPTGKPPVSQIADGQIQVPTGKPVNQISDGQVQVSTAVAKPPVTQIADGQVQVPTAKPPVVSQISDGQVQAPTSTAAKPPVVTQIADGQIQSPTNGTKNGTAPIQFTGTGSFAGVSSALAVAVGLLSMALL